MRVLPPAQPFKSLTKQLKLKDKNSEGSPEEEDDDAESQGIRGQEKEDPEEAEAEILSPAGMAKNETGTRINNIKKLLLEIEKQRQC